MNLVTEIQLKLLNERLLSNGEPCTCSFAPVISVGTLSIHWYIVLNFYPASSMFVFSRRSFQTDMYSRLLKVAIATLNLLNKIYNGGFALELGVSLLKETRALVQRSNSVIADRWISLCKISLF